MTPNLFKSELHLIESARIVSLLSAICSQKPVGGDYHHQRPTCPGLAEDKTYLINLFFVYYETTASRSLKWTRKSFKRWNKNTNTSRSSERVNQTRRNVKMRMHCIETDKAVKIMRKIATATALATATSIGKWLCSSVQIENMKTIWKVLKIFSSLVCSFHRVCLNRSPRACFGVVILAVTLRRCTLFAIMVLIYLFLSILLGAPPAPPVTDTYANTLAARIRLLAESARKKFVHF